MFYIVYIWGANNQKQLPIRKEKKKQRKTLLTEDEARSGRQLNATGEQMCKKVRDLVYSDRGIQVEEIAQALGISYSSVSTILHDGLGMCKLSLLGPQIP